MDAVKQHGVASQFEMQEPRWREAESGWDTGRSKWFCPISDGTEPRTLFPRGSTHPRWPRMYVADVDWIENGDETWIADVNYKGLLTRADFTVNKPYKRRIQTFTNTTSGNNITTPDFTGKKAEVKDAALGVRDLWISETEPSTELQGTAQTPPDAPSTPSNPWTVTDAIYLYPSGWVLESREVDQIENAKAWLVTDHYVYYWTFRPGDI